MFKYKIRTKRWSKFGNHKVNDVQYGRFDSMHERHVFLHLLQLEKEGVIRDLQRQVEFKLFPSKTYYHLTHLKTKFKFDKRVFRDIRYIADFTYYDKNGEYHVVDAKGKKTQEYMYKKKFMLLIHGIVIEEWYERNNTFSVKMGYNLDRDITLDPWTPETSTIKLI